MRLRDCVLAACVSLASMMALASEPPSPPEAHSAPSSADAPAMSGEMPSAAPPLEARKPTLVEKLREQPSTRPTTEGSLTSMMLGLAATLAILLALAWITGRLRNRVMGGRGNMRLIDVVAVGPREKICILEHAGKHYMLGVTQHTIQLIDTLEDPANDAAPDTVFSEKIKKLLQNGATHG